MSDQHDHVHSGPGTFIKYLKEGGYRADLSFITEDIREPGPSSRRVSYPKLAGVPGWQFLRLYKYYQAFAEACAEHKFDLLWCTAPVLGFLPAVLKGSVPVVLMVNDYSNAISRYPFESKRTFGTRSSLTRPVWRVLEKQALHSCDAVVVNSKFTKRKIQEAYGLAEEKMHLLYKAVDAEAFVYHSRASVKEPVRVLFMKTNYRSGGLSEVAAAVGQLPFKSELTVVGPAMDQKAEVLALIRQEGFGGKVVYYGRAARREVAEIFQSQDVLCMPSRAEALGVVFLEALASGTPAVGSNAGGIPEVLDYGRAGWLANSFDANDVSKKLIEVVQNDSLRKKKIEHGRSHVKNFSAEAMRNDFKAINETILGNIASADGASRSHDSF